MKKCKSAIICWSAIWIILAIVFIALCYNPLKKIEKIPKSDDVVTILTKDDIKGMNSCSIDEQGNITIIGPDAYIVFQGLNSSESTIAVELSEAAKENINAQLYVDYGNDFNESDSYISACSIGDRYIVFEGIRGNYFSIRVDIDSNYSLKQISTHSDNADIVFKNPSNSIIRIIAGLIISVIAITLLKIINTKKDFISVIIKITQAKYKFIIGIIIGLMVLVLGLAIAPINKSFLIFIYSIILVCILFIINFKTIKEKPEILFAEILFVIGLSMILLQPYGLTCWDTDSHYRWAIAESSFGNVSITEEDSRILANNGDYVELKENGKDNSQKISLTKKNGSYATTSINSEFSLPHMVYGVGLAILRLFNINFYWRFVLGKLPSLILYTLLCYFAMKKLKSGKMLLATIALFPTCVFLASNYTYDYWVTGFSLLGMAYFVGNCQEKDNYISNKDVVIMCVSLALACLPKLIYIGLLLIPFFMPKSKIKDRKNYYLINIVILTCLFVLLMIRSLGQTTGTGDLRGGANINPKLQIMFILSDIFGYVMILLKFLGQYLSVQGMQGYITNFAYMGIASGYVFFVILLVVTAIFDKADCDKNAFHVKSRLYVVVMFLGEVALVATAFYLVFTGVGADTILGCQPRYIVPLLYPVLAIIFGKGIQIRLNRMWFNYGVLAICACVLFYDIYSTMLWRVV